MLLPLSSNALDCSCLDVNECQSNPCENGAICNDMIDQYNCTCIPGYTGINCETGKTIPTCFCLFQTMHYRSCLDINECQSNPCVNGSTCSDMINQYNCTCIPGYTGIHCETGKTIPTCFCLFQIMHFSSCLDINECQSNPCDNGATCNDMIDQYSCTCSPDYTGIHCESCTSKTNSLYSHLSLNQCLLY